MMSFLVEFIKSPSSVGSIIPSSRFLINSMLSHVDFSKDLTIVELGSGDGNFTKEILKKATSNSKIYSFEINPDFIGKLKLINDDRFVLVNDSAEFIEKYIGPEKCDIIVSGLPYGSFPLDLTQRILAEAKRNLKKGGLYLQFQYFLQNKKQIKETFPNLSIGFQLLNIPPAFIYKGVNI